MRKNTQMKTMLLAAAILLGAGPALADVPYIFTKNTPATAAEVNANFAAVLPLTGGVVTGSTDGVLLVESSVAATGAAALKGTITSTTPGSYSAGVRGENTSTSGDGVGVYGIQHGTGWGVYGTTKGVGSGVYGYNTDGTGVYGNTLNGTGVYGLATGTGLAGHFMGNVTVVGAVSKLSGTFVQPHAKDAEREIQYAFFEGPEHAVFLRGSARLKNGTAVIETPEHFRLVAAAKGLQVQVTPYSADTRGLAVVERSPKRIVVKELAGGKGGFEFGYFITAVRDGFQKFQPVVENTHFKPSKDESAADFEKRYSRDDLTATAMRKMLIANGLLKADGKLNWKKMAELGWTVAEKSRNPPELAQVR